MTCPCGHPATDNGQCEDCRRIASYGSFTEKVERPSYRTNLLKKVASGQLRGREYDK